MLAYVIRKDNVSLNEKRCETNQFLSTTWELLIGGHHPAKLNDHRQCVLI